MICHVRFWGTTGMRKGGFLPVRPGESTTSTDDWNALQGLKQKNGDPRGSPVEELQMQESAHEELAISLAWGLSESWVAYFVFH